MNVDLVLELIWGIIAGSMNYIQERENPSVLLGNQQDFVINTILKVLEV